MFVKQVFGHGGPELSEGIAAHPSGKAERGAQAGGPPERGESHHNYVLDPPRDRLSGGSEVPWVFSPQGAHRRLHEVAGGDASEPHPITFAETLPMRAVLPGTVHGGSKARRE